MAMLKTKDGGINWKDNCTIWRQVMDKCGGCTACCTILGVKSLNKLDFSPCAHCTGEGCGIYSTRPKECHTYQCLWLIGNGMPEHRPDRLGVILEANTLDLGPGAMAPAIVVREIVPGASEEDYTRAFIGTVAQKFDALIYVIREDNTRSAFFPPWAAKYASAVKSRLGEPSGRRKIKNRRDRRTKLKKKVSKSRKRNR